MIFSTAEKRYIIYYPPGFKHSDLALELLNLCNMGKEREARALMKRRRLDTRAWRIETL